MRLKAVRKLWPLRSDGRPGIVVDENMTVFVEGCQGGYCYPERKAESEEPEKNETSHIQDTLQYLVTGHQRMVAPQEQNQLKKSKIHRIGHRTGL
jgi:hypothetical protein